MKQSAMMADGGVAGVGSVRGGMAGRWVCHRLVPLSREEEATEKEDLPLRVEFDTTTRFQSPGLVRRQYSFHRAFSLLARTMLAAAFLRFLNLGVSRRQAILQSIGGAALPPLKF